MRIAFVGKGGAGKTTLATFFAEYLLNLGKNVFALDADINIHFAQNLGISPVRENALSYSPNKQTIRQHLLGTNPRIPEARYFVKTTPPGQGSNLIQILSEDSFIQTHTTQPKKNLFVAHVGTYASDEIGVSCYHGNLGIAENIISHLQTDRNHWLVTDMVAGTDAFSGSMHLLFDAIFLVIEPTPEGLGVFAQYKHLAEAAGIWHHVWAVGNKIQNADDEIYLKEHLGEKLITTFKQEDRIRRLSQHGEKLTLELFGQKTAFIDLYNVSLQSIWNRQEQLHKLYELHRIHAKEDYVIARCGDVSGQIDEDFCFPEKS